MKTYRKFYVTLMAAALCVAMAVPAFAVSFSKKTDHYGTLTGDSHKYQNYLYTTTAVTSNPYNGTLHTFIEFSDGVDSIFGKKHYQSAVGATSLNNNTLIMQRIDGTYPAKYAFTTHEIRGGLKTGDYHFMSLGIK